MIVMGDLHLGRKNDVIEYDGGNSRLADTYARMCEVIAYVEPVIIAGDVFNTSVPSPVANRTLLQFLEQVGNKFPVFIIPGNHDRDGVNMSLSPVDIPYGKVFVIDDVCIKDIAGKRVGFVPHLPVRLRPESLYEYMQEKFGGVVPDIIIGHCHVRGVKNRSDVELESGEAMEFDSEWYPDVLKVFGHIHDHMASMPDKNVMYTGSVVSCDYSEIKNRHGFIRIRDGVTFIPFKFVGTEYAHIKIDLVSKDSVDFPPEKVVKFKGKLIKVSVLARDPMQVREREIRDIFNSVGRVTRFETTYVRKDRPEIKEDVYNNVPYSKLFDLWVEQKKEAESVVTEARKITAELLEEVGAC